MLFSPLKYLWVFILCCFFSYNGWGQQLPITESEIEIKGIPRKGQQILVELDSKVVAKAWENYLREKTGKAGSPISLPKSQAGKGVLILEKVKIDTISSAPLRIISKVNATPDGTLVWWTLDLGNAYVSKEGTPQSYTAAGNFLKDFARKVYAEDILRQVADAEKVLHNALNEQERVTRQAEDLKKSLDRNAARKLELEAELTRNAKEHEQFTTDIQNNLKKQEAARHEVENMKKAVEVVQNRLNELK